LLGTWHELELDVQLPEREPHRATRRVSLELAHLFEAPHVKVGAEVLRCRCESIRATTRRFLSLRR